MLSNFSNSSIQEFINQRKRDDEAWLIADENSRASKLLMKEADSGDCFAQFCLARLIDEEAVTSDGNMKAFERYKLAAERGSLNAMLHLAETYQFGNGVEVDTGLSIKWIKEAARLGSNEAIYKLGMHYLQAKVPRNLQYIAVKWFRKGARQGHAACMTMLGICHLRGHGTPVDRVKACICFKVAGMIEPSSGPSCYQELTNEMSDEQLFIASKQSRMMYEENVFDF